MSSLFDQRAGGGCGLVPAPPRVELNIAAIFGCPPTTSGRVPFLTSMPRDRLMSGGSTIVSCRSVLLAVFPNTIRDTYEANGMCWDTLSFGTRSPELFHAVWGLRSASLNGVEELHACLHACLAAYMRAWAERF